MKSADRELKPPEHARRRILSETAEIVVHVRLSRLTFGAFILRHNGGGNGLLNGSLLRELARNDTIYRRGRLFVILDRARDRSRALVLGRGEQARSGPGGCHPRDLDSPGPRQVVGIGPRGRPL
jgi:hypothetical protein